MQNSTLHQDKWDGSDYSDHASIQRRLARELLNTVNLADQQTLVDVGCGDGLLSYEMGEKFPRVTIIGIDPTASMLEKANARLAERPQHNVTYQQGFAESFTLKKPADVIFASFSVHWVKDKARALANFHQHLVPGGRVLMISAAPYKHRPYYQCILETMQKWAPAFDDFEDSLFAISAEEWETLATQAGFRLQRLEAEAYLQTFANQAALSDWIKQWLPERKHLPANKQDEFMQEWIDLYFETAGIDASGAVEWNEKIVFFDAIKI